MKVTRSGSITYSCGTVLISGWIMDMEGEPLPAECDETLVLLKAALLFIAKTYAIDLNESVASTGPDNFDAERAALDAIAVARWAG